MNPMTLSQALKYADTIVGWLGPRCERIEIAGSIRRERPECNDVDIVCIPRTQQRKRNDLLFAESMTENLVLNALREKCDAGVAHWLGRDGKPGEEPAPDAKQALVQLRKCQLDVWFATPETWATRLLCRTGSIDHNIWLCKKAAQQAGHWNPYEGLYLNGSTAPRPALKEADIYHALGLPWIHPHQRELDYCSKLKPATQS